MTALAPYPAYMPDDGACALSGLHARVPLHDLHHDDVELLLVIQRLDLYFDLFADKDLTFRQRMCLVTFQGFSLCRRGINQETVRVICMV